MGILEPDLVLANGRVYTVDDDFSTAEAVAIKGDTIVGVGSTDEVRRLAGDDTRVVDLEGRTVVPGFMDSHLHPIYAGKNLPQVQFAECRTISEMLAMVKERADSLPAGEWFRGSNHWTPDQLEERRLPYRDELDGAAPDNPFWANTAFHRAMANSPALDACGINRDTPEKFAGGSGYVFKDPETGEPNGHLLETAMFCVMGQEPPQGVEEVLEGIDRVQDLFLQNGITSVIDQGDVGPPFGNFQLMQRLHREGKLKVRWRMNHIGFEMAEMPVEAISDHIASLRVLSGFGQDWLRMGAVGELVLDGFIEDNYSREPYAEDTFGEGWRGILLFRPDTVMAICRAAAEHGLQMNVHVQGDGALDLALDTFESVHGGSPINGLRWTLEHGALTPTENNLRQIGEMGVVLSTQQPLYYWHSNDAIKFLGPEAENFFPNRTWHENGVFLRGGSDFDTAPLSPLFGIWTIVTRRNILGEVVGASQALPREEALKMYTRNGAISVFEDDVKGSIEPGKLADLAILSDDLMAVPEENIKDIEVAGTIVGGGAAYDPEGILGG
ncbi:MAG TPA: amidohydrolase [Actinomycetota bacterium]|nr:amidohydrolase [Actinomycetota bacterium]